MSAGESRSAVPPVRERKNEQEQEERKFRAATFYLEIPAEAKIGNASLFDRSHGPCQGRRRLFLVWTTEWGRGFSAAAELSTVTVLNQ